MDLQAINPDVASRLALLVAVLLVGSIVAGSWWLWRWANYGQVLRHQPRSNPPWMHGAATIALFVAMTNVLNAVTAPPPAADADAIATSDFARNTWLLACALIAISLVVVAVLNLVLRATPQDLGWPMSWRQLSADCGLGVVIALASLVPVYILQVATMNLFDMPATHPMLDRLQSDPQVNVYLAVLISAVVAAPLFEELLFRLLLQGGLEHWENSLATGHDFSDDDVRTALSPDTRSLLPGLNHGWAPILASSFLFAIAHLGHGPSPLPLFVFALFLGYAYQRTHRIVPCIAAHATFNFFSVLTLMLAIPPDA